MTLDNEKSIIGACFLEPDVVDVVLSMLEPSDFAIGAHKAIFQAMVAVADKKLALNHISIANELAGGIDSVGGSAYIAELVDFTPTAAESMVRHCCSQVKEQAKKRKLRAIAEAINRNINEMSADELQAKTEAALFSLGETKKEGPIHVRDTLKSVSKQIEEAYNNRGRITGIPTGIDRLDNILCGLNPTDLTIVAARPGMGKSALAGNFVENNSVRGDVSSLIFSCEMSREQWVKRILYSIARVDGARARVGNFVNSDWAKLTHGMEEIHNSKVWIDDTPGIHISELRSRARRVKRREDIGLIVVDYLQLMTGDGDTRQQEIGSISRGLKGLAKELNVPVIALSQLNRELEKRQNKRPIMADLREAGDIEQDADNILFLYREAIYNPKLDETKAEIIVGKQRNGPTGMIPATWLGGFARFENREEHRECVNE